MTNELSARYQQHFLAHPVLWGWMLLIGWFGSNALVLATTKLMEMTRGGHQIPFWEPLSWELSSAVMILLLVPVGIYIHDRWLASLSLKGCIGAHLILTLPFSLSHVAGMVGIRHVCYWLMGEQYYFGNIASELLYEYRKDAQTYLTLLLLIFGFRLIYRRLQGEASYLMAESDTEQTEPEKSPEMLLIKKLGREFLIKTADIEWVEASGNYANLHVRGSVYPMRITMDKLEKLLPADFVRIHRSSIVNLHQIQEVQPLDSGDHEITLKAGNTLILSRRYRDSFKNVLSL
ncbi:LytTR family DNA-binding domain-containing protein [Cellvibrio sp. pealriver]|uniref:LytR/AlgR family response regulator transcription factor n=1 Tax=Cellvibrio sp. pealriver TaxID=1622269 RepID=UPI00066FD0C0|nr:LytTR family DNA-binding domain-containing protein [Cellvibrio sp. pealriver]